MTRAFKVSGDAYSIQGYVSNCMGSQVKLGNSCEQEGKKVFPIRLNTFFCSHIQGEKLPVISTKNRGPKIAMAKV